MRPLFTYFASALIAALTAMSPVQAFDLEDMTDAERAAFGDEVRTYLLANPQVILDAVELYRQAQEQAADAQQSDLIKTFAGELYGSEDDGFYGNPEGDIVIVKFNDYTCGYCKQAYPELQALVETDDGVKLIIKEYPIRGEASELATRYAIAAKIAFGMDVYHEIHGVLMTSRGTPNAGLLARISKDLVLDHDAITALMDSSEVNDAVRRVRGLGQQLGVNGTPFFIINDAVIPGYVPLDQMREIIAELRG